VRTRRPFPILRILSLALISAAVLLFVLQLVGYSRLRAAFPTGMIVAGVPVGGLTQQQGADRLIQVYNLPVELHYDDAIIQMKPSTAGFELDLEAMLAAADLQRVTQPFWSAFWDYLWDRLPAPAQIPIRYEYSEERLRVFLEEEIAPRYDKPPTSSLPQSGGVVFESGAPGTQLDIDRAVILIEDALLSPNNRSVNLSFQSVAPPRPSIQNLQILLQRIIELSTFDGIAEVYLLDLQTRQELSFAVQEDANLPPDIAFTAASTMKIPIMVSTFRRLAEPAPDQTLALLELMIERSENDPTDALMDIIGGNLGPLLVTDDLESMGFQNTFIAGYFYIGAPLLQRLSTPANQRSDVNTFPDAYNQTTPAEIGMLLDDIYQCAGSGGGTLAAVFPGEVVQEECRLMINYLTENRIALLLQAGLPDGTRFAHKHGWTVGGDGLIHTMSDAGIVYSPGGNYVIVIFLYDPFQLVFDPANELVGEMSAIIYNYFNLP
jgi:beta-lactamase class A